MFDLFETILLSTLNWFIFSFVFFLFILLQTIRQIILQNRRYCLVQRVSTRQSPNTPELIAVFEGVPTARLNLITFGKDKALGILTIRHPPNAVGATPPFLDGKNLTLISELLHFFQFFFLNLKILMLWLERSLCFHALIFLFTSETFGA